MSSAIFQKMGLGNLDYGYFIIGFIIILIVLFILVFLQNVRLNRLNKKYNKFMIGRNASSLESDIITLYEDNKFMKNSIDKNNEDISDLFENMKSTFQKLGLIKYDAFQQMGGKLSYSMALLDENNNGIILNSVHSTDGCYTYTKEIVGGESAVLLGVEEKQALEKAMKVKNG